ncbi:Mov34-domain-containing protein [Coniochaeta sp. PMI_546]|nr:Mov34-domain-containing protein [Coniochaeta sp. PMI_546]
MASMELPPNPSLLDNQRNALYAYDPAAQKDINAAKPWRADPHHFTSVRISAAALMKMTMHARSGGELEVMGLMQGYVDGTALVVTDSFRLPVEGTETRVNAQAEADEYSVEYSRLCREEVGGGGRQENVVGWYHSHPGYGCWLSGIDVATQKMLQTFQDPWVAVVIDPHRTVSSGTVDIGAFRTFPDDYKGADTSGTEGGASSVPLNKAADFGAHADKYYPLEVEHFKSTLDDRLLESLWNRYWVQTLSQNPLLTNRDYAARQMGDLAGKAAQAASLIEKAKGGGGGYLQTGSGAGGGSGGGGSGHGVKAADAAVSKVVADAKGVAAKEEVGLVAGEVKAMIFKPTLAERKDEDVAL